MARERLIEFLIGITFIVLLILIVVITLNISDATNSSNKISKTKTSSSSSEPIVINNYYENNYNYPENPQTRNVVYKYPIYNYVVYKEDYNSWRRCYDWDDKDFSSYGTQRKIKDNLNYIDEYSVFVKNEENDRKYFKVVFYFEDSTEFGDSQEMIKLIKPGEWVEFKFRDSHFEKNNYLRWSYDVFSQDDGFDEALYESNSKATSFRTVPSISCR